MVFHASIATRPRLKPCKRPGRACGSRRAMANTSHIHVSRLVPHPGNIRQDTGDAGELAASVRAHGILQPLVVQPHPQRPGSYLVLAGHRRLEAAKAARLETVPVTIRAGVDAAKAIEIMLVENCQRSDLTNVEKAEAMGRLRDRGYTATAIARATGLSISMISSYLALLELDEGTREQMKAGNVQWGDAIKAVRRQRKAARGSRAPQPGRRVQVSPPWFTTRHRLADYARGLCEHTTRPMVGTVACGQCWEQAIRDDENESPDEPGTAERLSVRQERIELLAEMRLHTGSDPCPPGAVTARQAAERLGVTARTVERYKADLRSVTR
jgi:ParB family chromosome partitioning protein